MMKEVRIQIGMRWNHPSVEVICRETERFLSWLTQFESTHLDNGERIPVYWNLPSYPFLELRERNLNDLILEIKTRIQGRIDIPVSMGYSGGFHPLLSLSELKKECQWGISNPWGSGIKDFFGKVSPSIMPMAPDVLRPEALDCYRQNHFTAIGINRSIVNQLSFESHIRSGEEIPGVLFYYPLSSQFVTQCKRDVKKVLEETDYTLPFFFDCMYMEEVVKTPFDFNPLTNLLLLFMSKYTVTFTSFDDVPQFALEKTKPYINSVAPPDHRNILPQHPVWKQKVDAIKDERRVVKKSNVNMRNILQGLSPLLSSSHSENGVSGNKKNNFQDCAFPPEDRINTADMLGDVSLSGAHFSVSFQSGKIKDLTYKKNKLLTGELPRSYFSFSHGNYECQSLSAFSITGDGCRGLREIQKIVIDRDEPHGTLLTDYIFVEDFPYLIVTTKVTYPFLPSHEFIDEYAFFELPLLYFHKEKPIDLHVFSNKSIAHYSLEPVEHTFTLSGQCFIFSSGSHGVIIGFPPHKCPNLQVLGIRMRKRKKGMCLHVNIGGSYFSIPAGSCSRITEIFSYYIGINVSGTSLETNPVQVFPEQVLEFIPDNCVINNQG